MNDILDYSKIEAGKIELECIPFDIVDLIETAEFMFKDAASEKGIGLEFIFPREFNHYYKGDPLRIKQILLNLCSNAIKFTEEGSVTIHVDCVGSQAGQRVQIKIADTGIGMSQDQVEKVFSRFEQADTTTTLEFGGTGLGVPITKAVVDLMIGDLSAISVQGKGTEFTVSLPLEFAEAAELKEEKADVPPPDLSGKRALIVEDNQINQVVCETMLSPTNADVMIAENGQECLDLLKHEVFDLILVDIQMPVMGGNTACEHIRSTDKQQKVIVLTANVMADDRKYMRKLVSTIASQNQLMSTCFIKG